MSSRGGNPFLEEDEVDDFTFLNHPKQGRDGYMLQKESNDLSIERERDHLEAKQMQLREECRRIEERTLQSSVNSLSLLHESEDVGIITAESLVHQREQLQNVEQNLDTINSTMRISQKHINSIKSMFGGIKNYFSRGSTSDSTAQSGNQAPDKLLTSGLQETVENLRATEKPLDANHPALRIRGIGIDSTDLQAAHSGDDFEQSRHDTGVSPTSAPRSYVQNADEQLDKNLELMSSGLGRLKNLAIGLNEEIETQNDMLDRIHTKVDRADESLVHQNRQIKRILKK